jgi:hypothetical protein
MLGELQQKDVACVLDPTKITGGVRAVEHAMTIAKRILSAI